MAAPRSQAAPAPFGPQLFAFLRDLREHNDREWFKANKDRFETSVQEPALDFIEEFAPRLRELSPHLVADPRPVGGSLFRIYRDTRFSKDKRPFKTNVGIFFRHERARDTAAPGLYLHLGPDEVFAGGGLRHPGPEGLRRIRDAIATDPDGWVAATQQGPFAARYRLWGDALKRPPAGYDAGHPLVEELKRKEFIAVAPLEEQSATSPAFADELAAVWRGALPFMRFLCRALEVPF
jgi:uncharacterized protein (TIGR02453 family)